MNYNPKTGKYGNIYNIELNEGYRSEDGDTSISFNDIKFMLWRLKEGCVVKDWK